jgi:hypothetical protein
MNGIACIGLIVERVEVTASGSPKLTSSLPPGSIAMIVPRWTDSTIDPRLTSASIGSSLVIAANEGEVVYSSVLQTTISRLLPRVKQASCGTASALYLGPLCLEPRVRTGVLAYKALDLVGLEYIVSKSMLTKAGTALAFLVALTFSASAQESQTPAKTLSSQDPQDTTSASKPSVPPARRQQTSSVILTPEMMSANAVRFEIKDSKLYFVFPIPRPSSTTPGTFDVVTEGIFIPVPGGGASGCFSDNLEERIRLLKGVIDALPAR